MNSVQCRSSGEEGRRLQRRTLLVLRVHRVVHRASCTVQCAVGMDPPTFVNGSRRFASLVSLSVSVSDAEGTHTKRAHLPGVARV